jgi:hypothetical protein
VPETTTERVVFAVGLAVVAALVFLIVTDRKQSGSAAPRLRTGTISTLTGAPTTTALPTTTSPASLPPVRTGSHPARLRLTARASTWLSVHRNSPGGDLLFEGTLAAGSTKTFAGTAFGVRFGAAANVEARLNGRPLSLPGGTYSTTITRAGVGPLTS